MPDYVQRWNKRSNDSTPVHWLTNTDKTIWTRATWASTYCGRTFKAGEPHDLSTGATIVTGITCKSCLTGLRKIGYEV